MDKNTKILFGVIVALIAVIAAYAIFSASPEPTPMPTDNSPETKMESTESMTVADERPEVPQGTARYVINSERSTARFSINEVLRGTPKTVIGETSVVTGYIDLNAENPSKTAVSTISVDAETLKTDDDNRNRMLSRFILQSTEPQNAFITFEPTDIQIATDEVIAGNAYDTTIKGDLTVRSETREVEFDGSVTLQNEDELSGTATATILYSDFGINIPSVPFVANVSDEVILEIQFVAERES